MRSNHALHTLTLALGLCFALASGACSTTQSPGTQVDDAWITSKIKTKYAGDPEVSALNIDVDTNEGVVTLTGRVADERNHQEAVRLARETEGVKQVRDLLEVGKMTESR